MQLKIEGKLFELLGDPHLGRRFVNGVLPHRRGEREEAQWEAFKASLGRAGEVNYHVCMGDLFDGSKVPYEVIVQAADLYVEAAKANPKTRFIVLRGNHDASRDVRRVSAFDVFSKLVAGCKNIDVVEDRLVIGPYAFFGFDPFVSSRVQVTDAAEDKAAWKKIKAVFGHWAFAGLGSDGHQYCPRELLAGKLIVSGHEHAPKSSDGLIIVGSMLPYSHGEDPDEQIYVTRSLDQIIEDGVDAYKDKCLRVLLKPGEEAPSVDCLQLTVKRVDETGEDSEETKVQIETFDFRALFDAAFAKVDPKIRDEFWKLYQETEK